MRLEFLCPKCGGDKLEEIMVGVTVVSEVVELVPIEGCDVPNVYYGDQYNEDGSVDRYQCAVCGHTISEGRINLNDFNPALSLQYGKPSKIPCQRSLVATSSREPQRQPLRLRPWQFLRCCSVGTGETFFHREETMQFVFVALTVLIAMLGSIYVGLEPPFGIDLDVRADPTVACWFFGIALVFAFLSGRESRNVC